MGRLEAGSNRWKTARERDRLKARHSIRTRVASHVKDVGRRRGASAPATFAVAAEEGTAIIALRFLRAIVENDHSAFSAASLARHGRILSGPLPSMAPSSAPEGRIATFGRSSDGTTEKGPSRSEEEEVALRSLPAMLSTEFPWERHHRPRPNESARGEAPLMSDCPQPTTLATSKYGRDFVAERLVPYIRHLCLCAHRGPTFIEYASLLGRHRIVASLLLGGVDPTVGSIGIGDECDDYESCDGDDPLEAASRRVLALFHSLSPGSICEATGEDIGTARVIPLSMWSYMVRAVLDMRMNGILAADACGTVDPSWGCTSCGLRGCVASALNFGPPCHHSFCEPCLWNHLVERVPLCSDMGKNVVTCPICDTEFKGFQFVNRNNQRNSRHNSVEWEKQILRIAEEKKSEDDIPSTDNFSILEMHPIQDCQQTAVATSELRQRRRLDSLAKFMALSPTSAELKSAKRSKRKKDRDAAHGTWGEALQPFIKGRQSRNVRSDRFFRAVLMSHHWAAAYLNAGMDVNMRNAYGQTPIYMACWKGSVVTVQWLLEYGADVRIAANGGSTCCDVARKHRREDVLHLLGHYCKTPCCKLPDEQTSAIFSCNNDYQVSILIDPVGGHPGAGACMVDNALSRSQLQQLMSLWQSLPLGDETSVISGGESFKETNGDKTGYRPSRSYFCDAEGKVQEMLVGCIQAARLALTSSRNCKDSALTNPTGTGPPSSILHNIRFLNYDRPGGVLPAHVDLCRVDDGSGLRSTHTFILYLSDCERGGGTALLKDLKDPRPLAVVKPKRGRALIFPHLCPHSGLEVETVPKLLLRGEVILDARSITSQC